MKWDVVNIYINYDRIKKINSQVFWNKPVISAFGKLGKEHQAFKASFGYIANFRPVRVA